MAVALRPLLWGEASRVVPAHHPGPSWVTWSFSNSGTPGGDSKELLSGSPIASRFFLGSLGFFSPLTDGTPGCLSLPE